MAAYQLLDVLLDINSVEEAQTVSIPNIIYRREARDDCDDAETLEILSLLTEVLLRLGRCQEAKEVAKRALTGAEQYKSWHGVEHHFATQS